MKAQDIFRAIRDKHRTCALVPEVVISDDEALDAYYSSFYDLDQEFGKNQPFYRRIDALMFDSLQRTAIEIKVSTADWKRDTPDKRRAWERVTHRFIYAVPHGMEPPEGLQLVGCGIWWVSESGKITVHRKARVKKHPEPLPQQVVQALAYRATPKLKDLS